MIMMILDSVGFTLTELPQFTEMRHQLIVQRSQVEIYIALCLPLCLKQEIAGDLFIRLNLALLGYQEQTGCPDQ